MNFHRKAHNQRNLALNGKVARQRIFSAKPQTATTAAMKVFYRSIEWRKMRYGILVMYGRKCMCCHQTNGVMHVDHIKPLRYFWGLRLDPDNLQVLCEVCNHGKSHSDWTDFRPKTAKPWEAA